MMRIYICIERERQREREIVTWISISFGDERKSRDKTWVSKGCVNNINSRITVQRLPLKRYPNS